MHTMFESFNRGSPGAPRHRVAVTSVSVLVHAVVLGGLLLIPLLVVAPSVPGLPNEMMAFVAPPPAPPPPPPPAAPPPHRARAERPKPAPVRRTEAPAPIEAPSTIKPETVPDEGEGSAVGGVEGGIVRGVEGGVVHGLVGGVVGGLGTIVAPPTAPPPAPIRVGGNIKTPALISHPQPEYPSLALMAHVEGTVILEATVDKTGHVESARVLRSAGVLDAAAVAAVEQWRYSPLILNGRPEPFIVTVTAAFHLGHRPA
jgi:protein TonB